MDKQNNNPDLKHPLNKPFVRPDELTADKNAEITIDTIEEAKQKDRENLKPSVDTILESDKANGNDNSDIIAETLNEAKQLATTVENQLSVKETKDIFFAADFEEAQRKAKLLANSSFVPDRFKGNIADCTIALDIAQRLNVPPITVLQETYIVHGTPGFSSKFIVALINMRGGFAHDLRFKFNNDINSCFAWTTDKAGQVLVGPIVTLEMAKREGWIDKKGSKWQTMPETMLGYRAASFFAKRFAPQLLMGLPSVDELHDIVDITPVKDSQPVSELNATLDATTA